MLKKIIKKTSILALIVVGVWICIDESKYVLKSHENAVKTRTCTLSYTYENDELAFPHTTTDDWDIFISSLIQVESEGDWNAVGKNNDVGVLQITPVLVEDVNRIIGANQFSLEDRRDSVLSVQMFNIIQNHYNKNKDKRTALKLWNPNAPETYYKKVMNEYKKRANQFEANYF